MPLCESTTLRHQRTNSKSASVIPWGRYYCCQSSLSSIMFSCNQFVARCYQMNLECLVATVASWHLQWGTICLSATCVSELQKTIQSWERAWHASSSGGSLLLLTPVRLLRWYTWFSIFYNQHLSSHHFWGFSFAMKPSASSQLRNMWDWKTCTLKLHNLYVAQIFLIWWQLACLIVADIACIESRSVLGIKARQPQKRLTCWSHEVHLTSRHTQQPFLSYKSPLPAMLRECRIPCTQKFKISWSTFSCSIVTIMGVLPADEVTCKRCSDGSIGCNLHYSSYTRINIFNITIFP